MAETKQKSQKSVVQFFHGELSVCPALATRASWQGSPTAEGKKIRDSQRSVLKSFHKKSFHKKSFLKTSILKKSILKKSIHKKSILKKTILKKSIRKKSRKFS